MQTVSLSRSLAKRKLSRIHFRRNFARKVNIVYAETKLPPLRSPWKEGRTEIGLLGIFAGFIFGSAQCRFFLNESMSEILLGLFLSSSVYSFGVAGVWFRGAFSRVKKQYWPFLFTLGGAYSIYGVGWGFGMGMGAATVYIKETNKQMRKAKLEMEDKLAKETDNEDFETWEKSLEDEEGKKL